MAKQSSLAIPADAALLYDILTDYDHLAEWMPQVSTARLLAREGDLSLAELTLAGAENLQFAMECIHSPGHMVTWRPVETNVPITEYQWTIESASGDSCRVSLALQRPGSVSRLSSGGRNGAPEAEQYLEALRMQASVFLPFDPAAEPGSEKIFEIVETATGLVCWLQGRKYRLVPEPEA
jgi:ribosome-associated toxin RatA of RatAB toxin-antitoxin module